MLLQQCIIYSVASTTSALIDERLEHELQTNRRNDDEERRRERLCYRRRERRCSITIKKHFLYACSCELMGCTMMCTFRVTIRPIIKRYHSGSGALKLYRLGFQGYSSWYRIYRNDVIISVIGPIIIMHPIGSMVVGKQYRSNISHTYAKHLCVSEWSSKTSWLLPFEKGNCPGSVKILLLKLTRPTWRQTILCIDLKYYLLGK